MYGFSFAVIALVGAMSGSGDVASASNKSATIQQPALKAGDSWVFEEADETGQSGFSKNLIDITVERADGDTILVGVKRDGAPTGYVDSVMGADWSRRLFLNGKETITNRPFVFPMSIGQSWNADWDDVRHGNVLSGHAHRTCTAVGWEDVTVPAGAFHAVKVVCKGVDEMTVEVAGQTVAGTVAGSAGVTSVAHAQRGGQAKVTHVTYAESYYVPELRNYVKAVDEKYNATNVRLARTTSVLVSLKPAN